MSGMDALDRLLEPGRLWQGALAGDLLQRRLHLRELVPGTLLGAFRIERELGRGGMGIVYLATRADGAYAQQVAIKWLPVSPLDTVQSTQFRRERQILAQLNHPNIARLLDGGCSEDGHLWFALEHVEGLPIDRHAAAAGLDWQARVRLLLPVVEAVQCAHGQLLVHRDIKPDNVLVDGNGQAKLIDFGVAAMLADADVIHACTPGFASPEQLDGAPVNTASDIWQLGHLLACVLQATSTACPAPGIPADLHAIIAKAKAPQPEHRYPTTSALRADLHRLLHHQPVTARRAGLRHRLHLLLRAHPLGSAISAMVTLAFMATIAGFLLRLTHERDAARHAQLVSEQVNDYLLRDFLPGADPLQAGSSDASVADLSEHALDRIETRLGKQPEVAGRVAASLGDTLSNLGRLRAADRAFRLAIAYYTHAYGPRDERTLRTRLALEKNNIDPSNLPAADHHLQPLREEIRAALGPHSALLFEMDAYLARTAFLRDDFQTCRTRYQALLGRLVDGTPDEQAGVHIILGLCESRLGRWQQALAHARTAKDMNTRNFGADHPLTLETQIGIESALLGSGRYDEAVQVLRELLEKLDHRYGRNHPTTLTVAHDLGLAMTCAGQPEAAARWLRQVAASRGEVLGRQHPWHAMTESVLGMALVQAQQLPEAETILAQAKRDLGANGANLPYVQLALQQNEADLALAQGRASEAATRYRAALDTARKIYPDTARAVSVLRLGLGLALVRAGQSEEGQPLLQAALDALGSRADCRSRIFAEARKAVASGKKGGG